MRQLDFSAEFPVQKPVDLYNSHYSQLEADVYREIRADTFGEDIGQNSWTTAAECDRFAKLLKLQSGQRLLEVACGSGGVCARFTQKSGVSAVGVDINEHAIAAANERARRDGLRDRAQFQVVDGDGALPFAPESFDVVFCNDAINHLQNRPRVLRDWSRVLVPGGKLLYTDPIVVTGQLSSAEIAARSSIGFFLFTPVGTNEKLISEAGLELIETLDLTDAVTCTSSRWLAARDARRLRLIELEGQEKFDGVQRFLGVVHALSSQRRLSRWMFLTRRT